MYSPLLWGEGVPRPVLSPAGAGQVRGRASVDRRFEISDADEIPAGDRYNSRGQRPRKTPPSRPDPERVESRYRHAGLAPRRSRVMRPPQGRGNERRAFRGRCPRLLSFAPAGYEHRHLTTAIHAQNGIPDAFPRRLRSGGSADSVVASATFASPRARAADPRAGSALARSQEHDGLCPDEPDGLIPL